MNKKKVLQKFHQDTIATVADRLFQQNGMDKTTMDEIAREADYSKATLYVYFKNKDEIFHFIALKYMTLHLEKINYGIATSKDALEQYKAICTEMASFGYQYPEYYNWMMVTISVDNRSRLETPILEEIYKVGESTNNATAKVITNGILQGYFREDINIIPTIFMISACILSIVKWANNKADYLKLRTGMDKQDFLEYCFELLLKVVLK